MPVYSTSCTDGRTDRRRASSTTFPTTRTLPRPAPEPLLERDGAVCALRPFGTSSRIARDFTCDTLQTWGLTTLADDATMVVSELVTNAIRHGMADITGPVDEHPVKLSLVRNGRFLV